MVTPAAFGLSARRSSSSRHFSRMNGWSARGLAEDLAGRPSERLCQALSDITSTSGLMVCSVRV